MRALLLTMLDLAREPNQRTQHVARMLEGIAAEVVVVTKLQSVDRSWRGLLRDVFQCSVRATVAGRTTTLALRPPLNYAQALAAGMVQGGRPPGLLRRALAVAMSLLGSLRDLVLVPAFVAAAWRHGRFELCIVDGPWTGVAALALRRLGRVDRIVYDDIDCVAGGQILRLRRAYVAALERWAIARCDLTICAGWRLGELRRSSTGRTPLVIPNGVDPANFAAAQTRRPHPPTLVFIGRLGHYIGLDLVIRALPAIRAAVPGARLLVVGDGDPPYVAGLRELAVAEQVAAAVEFRGFVPYARLADVLAESDVGVVRFRLTELTRYAFPLKMLEYFAAGLPVLAARDTDAETLLERHPAGLAVEVTGAGAVAAIAAGAVTLLGDPAAGHAEIARRAAAAFTWEAAMRREREAIEALFVSCPAALAGVPAARCESGG